MCILLILLYTWVCLVRDSCFHQKSADWVSTSTRCNLPSWILISTIFTPVLLRCEKKALGGLTMSLTQS